MKNKLLINSTIVVTFLVFVISQLQPDLRWNRIFIILPIIISSIAILIVKDLTRKINPEQRRTYLTIAFILGFLFVLFGFWYALSEALSGL